MEIHIVNKERVRKVPKSFSWVDQRLVREKYIDKLSHQESALYLFLVTVSNNHGLSYYSDKTLGYRLSLSSSRLAITRNNLIEKSLISYKAPIYQVLSLDTSSTQKTETLKSPEEYSFNLKSVRNLIKKLEEKSR